MPVQNSDVAEIFEKVADLLEIQGENQFRVRAYRDAARTVGGRSRSVAEMVEEGGDLTELPASARTWPARYGRSSRPVRSSKSRHLRSAQMPDYANCWGCPDWAANACESCTRGSVSAAYRSWKRPLAKAG